MRPAILADRGVAPLGVSVGTLYQYVADRDELIRLVIGELTLASMGLTWDALARLSLKRAWVLETAFGATAEHESLLASRL